MSEQKFKETEVVKIPEDWRECNLGDIATFRNGKSSPQRNGSYSYPVYGSNGIIGYSNKANSSGCTVIIGRVGSYCGTVYYSKNECWVTDNAIIGSAKENNSSEFLYWLPLLSRC